MTRFQRFLEMLRIDVVLVQADADVLRVDLDQLAQRVLQAPADGDGAAERGVEIGELLAADRAGGVDAGAGLVDDDVGKVRGLLGNLDCGTSRRAAAGAAADGSLALGAGGAATELEAGGGGACLDLALGRRGRRRFDWSGGIRHRQECRCHWCRWQPVPLIQVALEQVSAAAE